LRRDEIADASRAIYACIQAATFLEWLHRPAPCPPRCKPIAGGTMKELTLEEVLRIAGGVPLSAALDEVTYRVPQEVPCDPVEGMRLTHGIPGPSDSD
jgi:hypothetical protein